MASTSNYLWIISLLLTAIIQVSVCVSSVMTPRISAINSLQPVCVVVSFLVVSLSPFLSLSLYAFRWTGIYSEGVSVAYHSIY